MEGLVSETVAAVPSKKASKKSSKHLHSTPTKLRHRAVELPPSIADRSRARSPMHSKSSRNDRYSGLWECYYDNDSTLTLTDEMTESVRDPGSDAEGEGSTSSRLKNIRGFLLKKRKSPLKGWHKRYFILEKGVLYFSRNQTQMHKGKGVASLDLGFAFIHTDVSSRKITIDGEQQVLHVKTKNASHYAAWSACLLSHEMYRKAQLAAGTNEGGDYSKGGPLSPTILDSEGLESWAAKTQATISTVKSDLSGVKESLDAMSVYVRSPSSSSSALSATSSSIQSSGPTSHNSLTDLKVPLDGGGETLSLLSVGSESVKSGAGEGVTVGGKTKKKFKKGKQDKKNKDSLVNLSPEQVLPATTVSQQDDGSPLMSLVEGNIIRDDFTAASKIVYAQFCEILDKLDRLEVGMNKAVQHTTTIHRQQEAVISNQQLLLRQTMSQNTELRDRLAQIQSLAAGLETPSVRIVTPGLGPHRKTPGFHHRSTGGSNMVRFDSYMSLQSSMSDKFFDALDDLHEQSSDSEEEEEVVEEEGEMSEGEETAEDESDDSELFSSFTHDVITNIAARHHSNPSLHILSTSTDVEDPTKPLHPPSTGDDDSRDSSYQRRTKLLCPAPDVGDLSLWSLLRKNIGKDLSKISMPVSLNEPLSALQMLCEELEYSELLDQAAQLDDVFDRMVRVAAFAVSAYALSYYRAGRKPFNPILGETYECVREDKGFRFIAEQVSHHPPIAACHCESKNFIFWKDARIKSKFWGKSMEVFPIGVINVTLPKHGDHYQWEKVTSCIHNVFSSGSRWVDQYGEMLITNLDRCSCKLTFVKAGYWSSKKYIVHGGVFDSSGVKVRHLFGTWNEAMFCGEETETAQCIWTVSPMPPDHHLYYNFNLYALGLNEIEEGLKDKLPITDCRFRPDQRLLEEGKLQEASAEKMRVEQLQREARAERERVGEEYTPNFFTKLEKEGESHDEAWISKGNYWNHRDSGFTNINLPKLW